MIITNNLNRSIEVIEGKDKKIIPPRGRIHYNSSYLTFGIKRGGNGSIRLGAGNFRGDVTIGQIISYYDLSVPHTAGELSQGLPPIQIVNDTLISLKINGKIIQPGEQQYIEGPVRTIPLGYEIVNNDDIFQTYRVLTPITHLIYSACVSGSNKNVDNLGISIKDPHALDIQSIGNIPWY